MTFRLSLLLQSSGSNLMKNRLILALSSVVIVTLMTACNSRVPSVKMETTGNERDCTDIDRKLLKIDRFIKVVKDTSTFHMEEAAAAMPTAGITTSNKKERMLKDANRQKAELLEEHQKLGCETPEK